MTKARIVHLQHSSIFNLNRDTLTDGHTAPTRQDERDETMAMLNAITTQKSFAAGGVAQMLQAVRAKYAQYRVYRETLTELNALSGRELADLGLNRSMLKRIALEAAYGDI